MPPHQFRRMGVNSNSSLLLKGPRTNHHKTLRWPGHNPNLNSSRQNSTISSFEQGDLWVTTQSLMILFYSPTRRWVGICREIPRATCPKAWLSHLEVLVQPPRPITIIKDRTIRLWIHRSLKGVIIWEEEAVLVGSQLADSTSTWIKMKGMISWPTHICKRIRKLSRTNRRIILYRMAVVRLCILSRTRNSTKSTLKTVTVPNRIWDQHGWPSKARTLFQTNNKWATIRQA